MVAPFVTAIRGRERCNFHRLTNAFSKRVEMHEHAVALHFLHYNFCRAHETLTKQHGAKTTPAMAAGIADHIWTLDEVIGLIHEKPAGRFRRIGEAALAKAS